MAVGSQGQVGRLLAKMPEIGPYCQLRRAGDPGIGDLAHQHIDPCRSSDRARASRIARYSSRR